MRCGSQILLCANLLSRVCSSCALLATFRGYHYLRSSSVNPFAKHKVCGELSHEYLASGSDVDLRANDKAGNPLVKGRTRSCCPKLKDCGKAEPEQQQHVERIIQWRIFFQFCCFLFPVFYNFYHKIYVVWYGK